MKTALNQLIDKIHENMEQEQYVVANPETYEAGDVAQCRAIITTSIGVIKEINKLLETEKQQIMDAFDAQSKSLETATGNAKHYYTETFKK